MDNLHYLMLGMIIFLTVIVCLKNITISNLKCDLQKFREIKKEHDYYYKLAEILWNKYREYEIFPSAFAREIDEISKWY